MNLLKPKKHSWPHVIVVIAVVELYWLLFCWFASTHDSKSLSFWEETAFVVLSLAGIYFSVLFGTWYNDVDLVKKNDSHTSRL